MRRQHGPEGGIGMGGEMLTVEEIEKQKRWIWQNFLRELKSLPEYTPEVVALIEKKLGKPISKVIDEESGGSVACRMIVLDLRDVLRKEDGVLGALKNLAKTTTEKVFKKDEVEISLEIIIDFFVRKTNSPEMIKYGDLCRLSNKKIEEKMAAETT